ncbi:hypothetical protein AAC387_Pa12g1396 [Persea americana]
MRGGLFGGRSLLTSMGWTIRGGGLIRVIGLVNRVCGMQLLQLGIRLLVSKDFRIWKPSISREFSVKAFYSALEGNHLLKAPYSLVWRGLVPPQLEAFCWLAVTAKISTTDNLWKRGLTSSTIIDTCVMCHKELELVNHLLLHYEFTFNVWGYFIGRCGVDWCCNGKIANAIESWLGGCFVG